ERRGGVRDEDQALRGRRLHRGGAVPDRRGAPGRVHPMGGGRAPPRPPRPVGDIVRAIALNCTLKPSTEASSTRELLDEVLDALRAEGVDDTDVVHLVDRNVLPGVTSDEGDGDDWPSIRESVLAADIVVLGTPVWLGQPSSVAKRVLERMDAFRGGTDDQGRMVSFGRVAVVAVVGNEDGAHHVSAELYQALNDVGFTLAAGAVTYWVGEAMGSVNFVDLEEVPDVVTNTISMLARNTAHLATLLKASQYPGEET